MRHPIIVTVHLITTVLRVVPRGLRAVIAESVLAKHQLLILNRSRRRALNRRGRLEASAGMGEVNESYS